MSTHLTRRWTLQCVWSTIQCYFYLEGSRAEVHGDGEDGAETGVQAQAEQLVDGQSLAEQLQRQDAPAAPGKRQRAAEVHHLADRGQQRLQLHT